MKKFIIISDSTCDLSLDLINQLDVKIIPMKYIINNHQFSDDEFNRKQSIKEFYNELREGNLSTTTQITPNEYYEIFKNYIEDDYDILSITFSSALSGSFNSSRIAKEEILDKYPNANIMLFDSKCASMGEGLLVYYAATLKKEGKTIDEIYQWLSDNYLNLCHWFTVDDLNHLKLGGRLSGAAAVIGRLLKIKPVLHVDDEGRLISFKKAIGRKQSIIELFNKMKETGIDLETQTIFISHGDAIDDALFLKEMCLSEAKVKEVIIHEIGPVIGTHSGPGTIALFFLGTKR